MDIISNTFKFFLGAMPRFKCQHCPYAFHSNAEKQIHEQKEHSKKWWKNQNQKCTWLLFVLILQFNDFHKILSLFTVFLKEFERKYRMTVLLSRKICQMFQKKGGLRENYENHQPAHKSNCIRILFTYHLIKQIVFAKYKILIIIENKCMYHFQKITMFFAKYSCYIAVIYPRFSLYKRRVNSS